MRTLLELLYLLEYKSQLQRLFSLLLSMMRLILRISQYRHRSMYLLDDSGAWSTGFTRVAVLIVHEGVARVVCQNKPRV